MIEYKDSDYTTSNLLVLSNASNENIIGCHTIHLSKWDRFCSGGGRTANNPVGCRRTAGDRLHVSGCSSGGCLNAAYSNTR